MLPCCHREKGPEEAEGWEGRLLPWQQWAGDKPEVP